MDWTIFILVMGIVLALFLAGGVWIGLALATTGVVMLKLNGYGLGPMASIFWTSTGNFVLIALPLFLLMGEIILCSGVSGRFFRSITPCARYLPGRLYSVNVLASGIFSAISGSSVATAAAIGSVAIPELRKRGYSDRLNFGTIAAGGTLGILIPPSTGLIIYGSLVNANIAKLFMAGVVPGVLLMLLFMAWVTFASIGERKNAGDSDAEALLFSLRETVAGLLPIIALLVLVIGGIYTGWVTPTEAAVLGVVGAIFIGAKFGNLTFASFWEAAMKSVTSSAMIMFIVLGANVLSYSLARTDTSRELVDWVIGQPLNAWTTFAILALVYVLLGCFIDGLSIMVLTLPLVHPVIVELGFDTIWFGIVLIMLVEVGMITPPIGINLFVIQRFASHPDSFGTITAGALPFVALILIGVLILCFFPQLALWLPAHV